MIDNISNYISSIIILILAITIIELILPNSKNKKYVMFASTLVIMLSVINPILKVFGFEIDITKEVENFQKEMKGYENSSVTKYQLEENVYDTYVENLKNNMKQRLEDIGYRVLKTEIQVDKYTYEPNQIEMLIEYEDGDIQPIVIDVFGNTQTEKIYDADRIKIKEILEKDYGVKKEKIQINGE